MVLQNQILGILVYQKKIKLLDIIFSLSLNLSKEFQQLGMMVIAIGLSSYSLALFHLVNHAFYKGLLFLAAGAVIHAVADNQDFRKYGGLISFLPLTYSVILIASLSLVAFPFMTGFYSKDFILESAFGQYYFSSIAVYVIAVVGAIFTTLYSVKVLYLTFLTNPNGSMAYYRHAHEGDLFLSLPLVVLAIFSIFFGYITKDIFIGLGSSFFIDNSIFIHPLHEIMLDTEFAVPVLFKLLPLAFTILFSIFAIIYSEFLPESLINFKFTKLGYNVFGFFNQRFLIEMFYNKYITNLVLNLGGQTTKLLDKGSIELIGPYGLEVGLIKLSKNIACLSTGIVTSYALYILMGFVLYLLITYLTLFNFDLVLMFILSIISLGVVNFYSNLNNNVLESNFFNSIYFFCFKLKDLYFYNKHYLLIIYFFLIIFNLLNLYINPELPNLYVVEDNKIGSSGAESSSNIEKPSSDIKPQYKGAAESIHNQISEIDKKLSKLNPEAVNYEKEKEALLDERESLTDNMTLLNQYKSTRSDNSYIPQSSDNKRLSSSNSTLASPSKRTK